MFWNATMDVLDLKLPRLHLMTCRDTMLFAQATGYQRLVMGTNVSQLFGFGWIVWSSDLRVLANS